MTGSGCASRTGWGQLSRMAGIVGYGATRGSPAAVDLQRYSSALGLLIRRESRWNFLIAQTGTAQTASTRSCVPVALQQFHA